jgi:hypothetical protein
MDGRNGRRHNGMSFWVTMPTADDARRDAAREELGGMFEAIACLARLIAAGPVTTRERRLAAAIRLAVERARYAARQLQG